MFLIDPSKMFFKIAICSQLLSTEDICSQLHVTRIGDHKANTLKFFKHLTGSSRKSIEHSSKTLQVLQGRQLNSL